MAAAAEEITVASPIAPLCLCVDEAKAALVPLTAIAEHISFQHVLQHAVTLTVLAPELNHFLHSVEKCLVNDGFMPTGVQLALIEHKPRVVDVPQHAVKPFERHGAFWQLAERACGEAKIGHRRFESFESVVAGGV